MTNKTLEDALRKLIEHAHLYPVDAIDNESAMYDANLQEACRTATEWIISAQPRPQPQIPDEVRNALEAMTVYCESRILMPQARAKVELVRTWLDSQPVGEWVPVSDEIKYSIGDQIEVRVGPHSVSARWKGHGGGSFSFPDHIRLCRKTEANSE